MLSTFFWGEGAALGWLSGGWDPWSYRAVPSCCGSACTRGAGVGTNYTDGDAAVSSAGGWSAKWSGRCPLAGKRAERCSGPGWMGPGSAWAGAWLSGWQPSPWQGVGMRIFEVPSNPSPSMTPWCPRSHTYANDNSVRGTFLFCW